MKTFLAGALFGASALFSVTTAFAQDTVVIAPERETVIREYVKKKPLASLSLPGVELNIGNPLPDTVELVPVDVPDSTYDYVVIDNRTYLVERDSRKIIRIIE